MKFRVHFIRPDLSTFHVDMDAENPETARKDAVRKSIDGAGSGARVSKVKLLRS